jgi:N6-L-threonylcarbamoyladenine synthase
MRILAIETSCDETAIAVLKVTGKKFSIEAHQVASQIALHQQYGGVFPAMAKREHAKNITPLFIETLKEANLLKKKKSVVSTQTLQKIEKLLMREQDIIPDLIELISNYAKPKIDRLTVTVGPGLEPALWVGINFAKALALIWDISITPVNHMEGHILSVFPQEKKKEFMIGKMTFPMISLLVSGGHTEIVLVKNFQKYSLVGQTRDDAAGEAFDKVARMLELPYPGGPEISRLASTSRLRKRVTGEIKLSPKGDAGASTLSLPRPMIHSGDFNFSFSGLKTAVLYMIRDMGGIEKVSEETKAEIAREFEDAVCDVLIKKTLAAAKKYKAKHVFVGGGVSANKELSRRLTEEAKDQNIEVIFPTRALTTDNAIMIGIAGYFAKPVPLSSKKLIAQGNMQL